MCGYTSLVTTMTAVVCNQFDKLKEAISDIRQQIITPQHGQEDEYDNAVVYCEFQSKLKTCIRHHQDIMA